MLNRSKSTRSRAKLLPPPPRDFVIERLRGGGYNRVNGITVPQSENEDLAKLILRVPRFADSQHDLEVAVLRFVRQHTSMPVPEVKFVGFTSNNPLKQRYAIQSRISGCDLQTDSKPIWYPNLSHAQKCTAAKEFAELLLELQSVRHPYPGRIEAASVDDGIQKFIIQPFELETIFGCQSETDLYRDREFLQVRPFDPDWELPAAKPFEQGAYYFMCAQFGQWRALELLSDPFLIAFRDHYDRLAKATDQMSGLGYETCLCHLDLNTAPRNIMADFDKDKPDDLEITGVLDWDSAIFAPRFVGCAPPMWIWAWNPEEDEDERHAEDIPPTPEQQELKTHI